MPEKMFTKIIFSQLEGRDNSHIEKYRHSERTSEQFFLPFDSLRDLFCINSKARGSESVLGIK